MTVALIPTQSAAPTAHAAPRESSSDEMLLDRIAGGDRSAMCIFFARYRIPLHRWLVRLVQDDALAEDLLSEVFLVVWRKAASFKRRSSVSTWLLAIGRHKALSARRRRADAVLEDHFLSTLVDPADDPETAMATRNLVEVMRKSLVALSPEHREVIDLVYYHGRSVKEAAQIVGIAEPTVKTRMFYARRKLAEIMKAG